MIDWKHEISRRLVELKLEPTREAEIVEELAQHLDDRYAELLAAGATDDQALQATLAELSESELLKQELRRVERSVPVEPAVLGVGGRSMIADLWQDLRYGIRMLRKNQGLTAVVVLTLGLGIGVNTALFTMFYLFDRHLPQTEPGTIVTLEFHETNEDVSYFRMSFPEYLHLRNHTAVFSDIAASHLRPVVLADKGASEAPQEVLAEFVSDSFFSAFGTKVVLGRTFTAEEATTPGKDPLVVLSYGLWQSRFGGEPNILGQTVPLNGQPFVVVGVTARDFVRFGADQKAVLWVPLTMRGRLYPDTDKSTGMEWYDQVNQAWLTVHGRLKPDNSAAEANAEIAGLLSQLDGDHPRRFAKADVRATPLTIFGAPGISESLSGLKTVVLAATTMVLLIACINIAGLLLARAAARRREIGVRLCLGASRSRIVRQLMTESLLLAALGGVAGLFLAWWSLKTFLAGALLSAWGRADLAEIALLNLTPDLRILSFTLLAALVSCVVFGLIPALQATKPDLVTAVKDEGNALGQRNSRSQFRNALVVSQIALCLVLLIAAGLLLRGLGRAQSADSNFDSKQMLLLSVSMRPARYSEARARQFYQDLSSRLQALPGVRSVARCDSVPGVESDRPIELPQEPAGNSPRRILSNEVGPDFFDTVSSPIISGRGFTDEERRAPAAVVVVSEALAEKLWPGEDPLGKSVLLVRKAPAQVVGVARDARNAFGETQALMYSPIQPYRDRESTGRVLVRTSGDAGEMLSTVKTAAQGVDPSLALTIDTLANCFGETRRMKNARTASALSASLGLLALLLAVVGLYGVMAYSVAQRTREIGIRIALGAQSRDVQRLILIQGLRLVTIGVALGVAGSAAVSRVLSSLLFGLSPVDPLAYLVVSGFLMVVALLATYMPARRASRVDPLVALRCE